MPINLKTTKESSEHVNCLVYGVSGVGKTVLSSTAPRPIIMSAEGGLLSIASKDIPVIEVKTLDQVEQAIEWLKTKSGDYDTVCIDSLSEIGEVILADMKSKFADGRAAYGHMNDEVASIVRRLKDLPFNTYFICKQAYVEDEVGVSRYMPGMPGKTMTQNIPYMLDLVLCMRIGKDTDGKDYRYLQCQPDVKYDAKDRSGNLGKIQRPDLEQLFKRAKGEFQNG